MRSPPLASTAGAGAIDGGSGPGRLKQWWRRRKECALSGLGLRALGLLHGDLANGLRQESC